MKPPSLTVTDRYTFMLALDVIYQALREQHGVALNVEHAFSCEIEPFKQAYIERNFAPPTLFRDIRELDGEQATTAYGSLRDVPGDVDILIAGTHPLTRTRTLN